MRVLWRRFLADESAATAIEYSVLACMIAVGALAGFMTFGDGLKTLLGGNSSKIVEALNRWTF